MIYGDSHRAPLPCHRVEASLDFGDHKYKKIACGICKFQRGCGIYRPHISRHAFCMSIALRDFQPSPSDRAHPHVRCTDALAQDWRSFGSRWPAAPCIRTFFGVVDKQVQAGRSDRRRASRRRERGCRTRAALHGSATRRRVQGDRAKCRHATSPPRGSSRGFVQ